MRVILALPPNNVPGNLIHRAKLRYTGSYKGTWEKNKIQPSLLKLSTGSCTALVLLSIKQLFAEKETETQRLRGRKNEYESFTQLERLMKIASMNSESPDHRTLDVITKPTTRISKK